MTQQTLIETDTAPAACPADRTGFEIGWDHARHGLVPPAALMQPGAAPGQGWHAARAVFGHRTLAASRPVRQWLHLRTEAWQQGLVFEAQQVTPNLLTQIDTPFCPVTRQALGGAAGGDQEPVVVRLRDDAAFAAGNLAVLSRAAARAMAGRNAGDVRAIADRLARDATAAADGLDRDAWARLATLMSFAEALAPMAAARIPLRVLPPNRVRVLNATQGLQALLTMRLAAPGWSRRARELAAAVTDAALRHDFNLFVGAIAPRLMSIPAAADARAARWAQEDAWADGRVQRRWQHFAAQLTPAQTESLLQRLAETALGGVAGIRLQLHDADAAIDGWSLASRGRLARSPRLLAQAGRGSGSAARPRQNSSAATSPSAS